MNDNSIITKFELSEREKKLKADFFNRKTNKLDSKVLSNEIEESKNNLEKIPEEDMNKFFNENKNELEPQNINNNGISSQQMNIIYTQNKLMERNVDILQETQRSLQDFIIYNMRKDEIEKNKNKINNPILKEMLTPLYNNINELKEQVKDLSNKQNNNQFDYNNNNNTFNDINSQNYENINLKHSNLNKRNNFKVPNSKIKKDQNQNKENQKLIKEISNLKNTMTNLTEEMNKLGTNFNEKLNKVVEDTEKKNLKNIIGKPKLDTNIRGISKKDPNSIKSKILDEIDYNDFKNDLNNINLEKDRILNEYKSNIPEMKKLEKPKQKINYSYNLDFPTSPSSNLNMTKSSLSEFDNSKNIFNQNLANSKSKIDKNNTTKIPKKTKETNIPLNQNKTYQIPKEEKVDYSKLSVLERMKEYKRKMNEMKGQIKTIDNSYKYVNVNKPENLNPFEDYSMGNQKSVITLQNFKKEKKENPIIYNEIPEKPKYDQNIINKEIKNIKPINRNEITMMQVEPGEVEQRKYIEDELLKVCIDKIVTKDLKGNNEPYRNEIKEENKEFFSDDDFNNLTKEQIENYIRNAVRIGLLNNNSDNDIINKKKVIPKKEIKENIIPLRNQNNNLKNDNNKNEIVRVIEKEIITNNNMNNQNNNLLEKLILSLEQKFGGIESALNNLNNNKQPVQILYPSQINNNIPNIDEISRKVMQKLQGQNLVKTKINITDKNNKNESQRYNNNINLSESRSSVRISGKKKPSIKNIKENEILKKEKVDDKIFDENTKIQLDDLEQYFRMPHKINLEEYEVSQTSSYISDAKINNTYDMIKYSEQHIIQHEIEESNNDDNSISKGQDISDSDIDEKGNLKINRNYNNVNKNKTGLDLLLLKQYNENLPKHIQNIQNSENLGLNINDLQQNIPNQNNNVNQIIEEEQSENNIKPGMNNFQKTNSDNFFQNSEEDNSDED